MQTLPLPGGAPAVRSDACRWPLRLLDEVRGLQQNPPTNPARLPACHPAFQLIDKPHSAVTEMTEALSSCLRSRGQGFL